MLRDRKEDIPLLAQHFLHLFAAEMGLDAPSLTTDGLTALAKYSFPGNIRELKNILERGLIESRGAPIGPEHLILAKENNTYLGKIVSPETFAQSLPLNYKQAEGALINRALEVTEGNVSAAARLLDVDRTKVYRIMNRRD